jgi:hypothetical protein
VTVVAGRRTIAAMALTVTEAATRYPLSAYHIRRLVRAGIVKGERIGPLWTVDEQSLRRYLASERRPGRPPKNP